jgi:hypothetical protein
MHHLGWDWHDWRERRERRKERSRRNTPVESIVAGGVFTAVFGTMFLARGAVEWWWLFPMAFAGILPMVEGIRRLVAGKRTNRGEHLEREAETEKQILRAAQEQGGRLTAATAALRTSLTMKEAQSILEEMTKHGHAVMKVTEEGVLEFEFPEFLPKGTQGLLDH